MVRKAGKWMALGLTVTLLLTGCGNVQVKEAVTESEVETQVETVEDIAPETSQETAEESTEESEEEAAMSTNPKQVVVYFANWNLNEKPADAGGEVASIPWDSVSYVNHAFWAVVPADGSTETSTERRNNGEEARTEFKIVSTDPKNDYEDTTPSAIDPSMARNHFAEYAAYSEKYPDVNIMLSIGGWSRCGYFSEMAYTQEGRDSFVQSCMEVLQEYPWIDGIDIDWEYPGGSKDGERKPEGGDDQGCPIFGTVQEDDANFALLLSDLRNAMEETYGAGVKKLTACASASTAWTLPCQDWAAAEPYLDMINIMTYDLAGTWDGVTGHAGSVTGAKNAAVYLMMKDIPAEKLCIGSPMYAMALQMKSIPSGTVVGTAIESYKPTDHEIDEEELSGYIADAVSGYTIKQDGLRYVMDEEFDQGTAGWHMGYDKNNGAAYLYNDDESSSYYKWYLSYEDALSLQGKLDYIQEKDLAGIIVWESSLDLPTHEYIRQMGDQLLGESL